MRAGGGAQKFALWRWHGALLATTLVLTALDALLLLLIDRLMDNSVPGYKSNPSLLAPVTIFFFIVYVSNYRGLRFGWHRVLPYVVIGTAVFFPLIFITSLSRFWLGLPADMEFFYRNEYCPPTVGGELCGQALAHMVFCMTMRTLPLLVIIPAAFYGLLKINFLGVTSLVSAQGKSTPDAGVNTP